MSKSKGTFSPRRAVLGLGVALTLLAVVTGCSSDEQTSEPTEAQVSEVTDAPASEPTDAPASEATDAPASGSTEAPASGSTEAPASGSSDAGTSLRGAGVARLMETSTQAVLRDQSITLDGVLECNANVSLARGTVTGSCAGTDTDGNAIASTLDGTGSVTGINRCRGTFIVTSAGEVINENRNFNCI